jgi:UDP-2,3-diacylglucosamine pyrophosphatase LpxH
MIFADTIIISDLHLGSEVSRASAAMRMLKAASFNRLILLGDIFSDLNFGRLKKEHWKFLSYIRKLSNPKREIEVVWVEGNHDHALSQVMSHLVGIRVYQEYEWQYDGIRHLAIHGHQFDRFLTRNRVLSTFFSAIHLALQKFSFGKKRNDRISGTLRHGMVAAVGQSGNRRPGAREIKRRTTGFLRTHPRSAESEARRRRVSQQRKLDAG